YSLSSLLHFLVALSHILHARGHVFTFHYFLSCFFLFNTTPPTEIYTLSLHDALPILLRDFIGSRTSGLLFCTSTGNQLLQSNTQDRKSTRLNSSHGSISYAVFCLKKKKKKDKNDTT